MNEKLVEQFEKFQQRIAFVFVANKSVERIKNEKAVNECKLNLNGSTLSKAILRKNMAAAVESLSLPETAGILKEITSRTRSNPFVSFPFALMIEETFYFQK